MKYSLANYILNISSNDSSLFTIFDVISIGGEGSATDSITISMNDNLWTTTSYATGGWVHNKNLSKSGVASVSINQLSNNVAKLIQLSNLYYSGDYDSLTITLTDSKGQELIKCEDCFVQKIPDQSFSNSAGTQNWTFTCGRITIN